MELAEVWVKCHGYIFCSRTSRKVVGCLLHAIDTCIEASISTECGTEHAVLETGWILEIEVQLAIQTIASDRDAGADRCNI